MNADDVIGKMYEFGRERMEDFDEFTNSPREKWKNAGKREMIAELFRYLKELRRENRKSKDIE